MKPSAAIIIPTIGKEHLAQAVESAMHQTHENLNIVVVVDGTQYFEDVKARLTGLQRRANDVLLTLPWNTGGAWCTHGHRIYAAMSYLLPQNYIFFLDEDNWYSPDHVAVCVDVCERNHWDWCFALRNIANEAGQIVCRDECESLGQGCSGSLVDTNCYCFRNHAAASVAFDQVGPFPENDRRLYMMAAMRYPRHGSTGQYTVNYRPPAKLPVEFFIENNKRWNARP